MPQFETRHTLIYRAKNLNDEDAWRDISDYYRGFVYSILKKMMVNEGALDDLNQEVLISLMSKLKQYDQSKGKFRSWLGKLVANQVKNYFRSNASETRKRNIYAEDLLSEELQNQDNLNVLIEKEWSDYITQKALDEIRESFKGKALDVFTLSLAGRSVVEIEQLTQLKPSSIYTLRNRVKAAMVSTIKRIIDDYEL